MLGYAEKDAFANLQGIQNMNNRMMQKFSNNRYGLYSNNPVKPNLNGMIFKTDENGVPTPLSEDEMALLKQKSKSTSMGAAREAASPWYDFLKHPQNTPYELEQMRNQGILRDAAIAAAMNKPVFYPEADTLSEPMAKLAGQQSGLAQSAMQQLTSRQGMAQNLFGQGANLVTTLAGKSLESDLSAQTYFANAQRESENSKIVKEQAEKLFKDNNVPKEIEDKIKGSYGTPQFIEVVRSAELEKYQALASQYDALMRTYAYLQNSSDAWKQRGNAQLAKSSAYMKGADDVDKNLELGININPKDVDYKKIENEEKPSMASQGKIGVNLGNTRMPSHEQTPSNFVPKENLGDYLSKGGYGNFSFVNGKVVPISSNQGNVGNGKNKKSNDDPILKRVGKLLNKDVSIANYRKTGVRDHLATAALANADNMSWQKDILSLASDLSSLITKSVNNTGKYKEVIYPLLANETRYPGVRKVFEDNHNFNLPKSTSLANYGDDIKNLGYGRRGDLATLREIYLSLEKGELQSKANIDDLDRILRSSYYSENAIGSRMPLLKNTGLKVKARKIVDDKGKFLGYKVDLSDSFE